MNEKMVIASAKIMTTCIELDLTPKEATEILATLLLSLIKSQKFALASN